jgi:hypothetical protein
MWCPLSGSVVRVWPSSRPVSGRLVSSASSVQPVRCPPVRRPAGCCPPPSVRTRPSRPTSGGGGGDQVEAAGNRHHRNRSSPGGLPRLGAARSTAEQARTRATPPRWRMVGGCRWRTLAGSGAGGGPGLTLASWAGQAGMRSARRRRLREGTEGGRSARLPHRPRGCPPRDEWATTMRGCCGACRRVDGPGGAAGLGGGDGRAAPARPRQPASVPGLLPTAL